MAVAAGNITTASYTADDRTRSVTGGGGNTTSYRYDNTGNPTTVTSPSGNARDATNPAGTPTINTFTFDNLLAASTVPVAGDGSVRRQTAYGYDPSGRKTSTHTLLVNATGTPVSGGDGGTIGLTYYPDDRVASQTGRDNTTIGTSYDAAGNPLTVTDSTSTTTLTSTFYLDGLVRSTDDGSHTSKHGYDGLGSLAARADVAGGLLPTSTTTSYTYNDAELPVSMTSAAGGGSTAWSYDVGGRPTTETDPNGLTTSWVFNPDATLANQTLAPSGGGGALAAWTYGYDNNARITSQAFTGVSAGGTGISGTFGYGYDTANRLASFTDTTGTRTISFDHDGNRTRYGTATASYNADDSLRSTSSSPTVFGYFLTADNYRTAPSTADLSVGVDPLTRNTYSYVNGDPVNLVDPSGHCLQPAGEQGRAFSCDPKKQAQQVDKYDKAQRRAALDRQFIKTDQAKIKALDKLVHRRCATSTCVQEKTRLVASNTRSCLSQQQSLFEADLLGRTKNLASREATALLGCPGYALPYVPIPEISTTEKVVLDVLVAAPALAGGLEYLITRGLLRGAAELVTTEAAEGTSAALDTTPGGRLYSAHYLNETGLVRNVPGSVVDETIDYGNVAKDLPDRTVYYDPNNDVTVVQSKTTGKIMSVRRGAP